MIETVTEQIMVQPPEILADGTVLSPAIYRSETQQRIVRERRETWFETPCEDVWTEEFTTSVQRALKVRGIITALFQDGGTTHPRGHPSLSETARSR